MIQKEKRMNKRYLAIAITASVLVLLIAAYVVLTAILPGIASGKDKEKSDPPEILTGEALYSGKAIAYPYLQKKNITSITVGSHVDKFSMVRPADENDENKLLDYFIFYYEDENGNLREYFPNITSADADFNYTDLYAKEEGDGLGAYKVDYLCAALGALFFDDRIALSSDTAEREAQLNRYGLGKEERETILLGYTDENGQAGEYKIYVGDKLISGVGYYFMIDGRECVYTSASSNTLSYALGGFEKFLHSRIIAAEMEGDKGAAPYHTKEYRQWTSKYYKYNKKPGEKMIIPIGAEVVVNADYIQPVYSDVSGEGTGYRYSGYRDISFDLASLSSSPEFGRLINYFNNREFTEQFEETVITVVTDMNEATLFDQTTGKGVYSYTIYKVEALLTDEGEISAVGTEVPSDGVIKVEYSVTLDGTPLSSQRSHAVIDLGAESVIPSEKKALLSSVGELASPVILEEVRYNSDNVKTRKIEYVITDISLIVEIDDATQGVSYLKKVTENSIVTYSFRYLLDGVEIGMGDTATIDMSAAKAGHYLNVKNALLGKAGGEQNISVADDIYCQPFMDFRSYSIKDIHGYVVKEEVSAFKFIPEGQRDSFYGESIYKNILSESNPYSGYAVNDEACDQVLRIISGIAADSNASGAQGVVGLETVAVGLDHANMLDYGLYDGYKIFFSLPRGLNPLASGEDYDWLYKLDFVLYISETQPDGTRYVGSEMYDIVVKIDGKTFDFLNFSFPEFWARRTLAMINVGEIDRVGVEFNMEDIYGKYNLDVVHETYYYTEDGRYPTKPEDVPSTEFDFITVRARPLGERHSDNALIRILAERNIKEIDLAAVYNLVAGIAPGDKGLSVGYDTLGTSSFKECLVILYSTYYLGVLSEEDRAKGTDENRLLRLSFDVGTSSAYTYNYDFHRIDDRRVMVSLYRTDSEGSKIGEVSDFYISTFGFKKIVNSFHNLLNGAEVYTETAY